MNAPFGTRTGNVNTASPSWRGNASMVATTRAMTCWRTSNEDRSLPPASAASAATTLASLSSSAGSALVEAVAGPVCARSIGCWIGVPAALAGADADADAAGAVVSGGPGCIALRARYTPATTMASTTTTAPIQLPADARLLTITPVLPSNACVGLVHARFVHPARSSRPLATPYRHCR